jgi:hypothetical protein
MNNEQIYLVSITDHEFCESHLFLANSEEIGLQLIKDMMPMILDDHDETEELLEMANDDSLTLKSYQDYVCENDLRMNLDIYPVKLFTSYSPFTNFNDYVISEKNLNIENIKGFDDKHVLYYFITDGSNNLLQDYLFRNYAGYKTSIKNKGKNSPLELMCIMPEAKKINRYILDVVTEIKPKRNRKTYFKKYKVTFDDMYEEGDDE